jgi:tRNA1Val (adenine37-N6)-methyltransferase
MRPTHFYFKQFAVRHDRCTMKVGTDGVLLGAWAGVDGITRALDIGTGSGVIALMLAQRTSPSVVIDAVEIEKEDADQARENVLNSPWSGRVHVHHSAIQDFRPSSQYDLIITNPPYFSNSQEPPDKRRLQTRHTVTLSYTVLLQHVKKFLTPAGRFCLILPYTEGLQFIEVAKEYQLHCRRQWSFRTRPNKPVERWLMEFTDISGAIEKGAILLYGSDKDEEWSESYKQLTRAFYLKA